MKKKWFITDMDGTFLNNNREISPKSKEVMKKLQQKGIKFFIATGRLDLAIRGYYSSMDLNDVVISCNGSLIRNPITKEVIFENCFSYDYLKIIYNKYKKYQNEVAFHIYTENYLYGDKLSFSIKKIKEAEKNFSDEIKTPIKIVENNIIEEIVLNSEKCYKVMLLSKNHKLLTNIYEDISKEITVTGTFSATDYFDIMPYGTNKGEGIKKVASYYNIDIADCVVFGDNLNDIDMLKVAGRSVCPSNSRDEIKKMCDEIIGSNDDFAVIEYIEKYIDTIGEENV